MGNNLQSCKNLPSGALAVYIMRVWLLRIELQIELEIGKDLMMLLLIIDKGYLTMTR